MSELIEYDQVLVPVEGDTYRAYSLLQLTRRLLRSVSGFGLAPLHFITQRGPYQDGETPLDWRLDPRTIQVVVGSSACTRTQLHDERWNLLDMLRPSRSFDGTVRPLIYRKWLPGGHVERGTDLATTAGSATITSATAQFVARGLEAGARLYVRSGADIGTYTVAGVPNDYTIVLTAALAATAADVHWEYRRGWARRDLYCLLEQGPSFGEGPDGSPYHPTGYHEVLRFVAHDPCWYSSVEQTATWGILLTAATDLVFDGVGGYLDMTAGVGRWRFYSGYVGEETVNLYYWGTVRAKPTITIVGPAIDPVVENTTIDATIEMDYEIAAGETVTIDTLALTVENDSGEGLLPHTRGDLATFGLETAPQAANRANEVLVTFAGGVSGASQATITWKNRYIGI